MSNIDEKTGIPKKQLAWLKTTCVHFTGAGNTCNAGLGTLGFTLLDRPCIGAHPQNCEKYLAPTEEEYAAEIKSLEESRRAIDAVIARRGERSPSK
jgi:hypothetical protein